MENLTVQNMKQSPLSVLSISNACSVFKFELRFKQIKNKKFPGYRNSQKRSQPKTLFSTISDTPCGSAQRNCHLGNVGKLNRHGD